MDKLNKYLLISNYLKDKINSSISEIENDEIYDNNNNKPIFSYFAGNLSSEISLEEDNSKNEDILTQKVNPKSIGIEFLVDKENLKESFEVEINFDFNIFYRIFPNKTRFFEEINKKEQIVQKYGVISPENIPEILKKHTGINFKFSIPKIYKNIKFNLTEKINLSEIIKSGQKLNLHNIDISKIIKNKLNEIILNDIDSFPKLDTNKQYFTFHDLNNWDKYKSQFNSEKYFYDKVDVEFQIELSELPDSNNKYKVNIFLVNYSKINFEDNILGDYNIYSPNFEFKFSKNIAYTTLHELKKDYKFDSEVLGVGYNCAIDEDNSSTNNIKTILIPSFNEKRIEPSNKNFDSNILKYNSLINEPLKNIKNLIEYMDKFLLEAKKDNKILDEQKQVFSKDLEDFENEILRLKYAYNFLKSDLDISKKALQAFILTNKTFGIKFSKYNSSNNIDDNIQWRLFQLIFFISNIPDIVKSCGYKIDDNDNIDLDLLYYPTGGGKTEAYISILLFNLFFDRIRGKVKGVTSMAMFPLKLLTYQQLKRFSEFLYFANIVLEKDNISKDNFKFGFLVGESLTPNKIERIKNLEKLNIVKTCPRCYHKENKENENIKIINLKHNIEYVCSKCNHKLPMYVVDELIYRYLPSVIIGTIDKIAAISFKNEFHTLLGRQPYGECPLGHGFSDKKTKCNVCPKTPRPLTENISGITLIIQDELHLLKESMGAFSSHYLSTIINFIKDYNSKNNSQLKIIGSTATITDSFKYQIWNLYNLNSRRFPSKLIKNTTKDNENFYYYNKDEIMRTIIGILPKQKTIIDTIIFLIDKYNKEINKLKNMNIEEINSIFNSSFESKIDFENILINYDIELSYHNAKNDLDRVRHSITTQLHNSLVSEKIDSSVEVEEIEGLVKQLESKENVNIEILCATSSISHGFHADRLNFMIFQGMPRSNSEFIQAMSRVGRKYPGFVITIFNPTRNRDISFYTYFSKYMKYKELLVEPISVNRFAEKTIEKTFPGLFLASTYKQLYPILKGNVYNANKVISKLSEDSELFSKIKTEVFKLFLFNDTKSKMSESFYPERAKNYIYNCFNLIEAEIKKNDICEERMLFSIYLERLFSTKNKINMKVLTSLRDVDLTLNIGADINSLLYLENKEGNEK